MEDLKFKDQNKKVIIVVFASIIFILVSFIISKYIWFYHQENVFFGPDKNYDSEVEYVKEIPMDMELNNPHFDHKETSLEDILIKLPIFKSDSIEIDSNTNSLTVTYFESNSFKKALLLYEQKPDEVNKNTLLQLNKVISQKKMDEISIDKFSMYNFIYSYKPKKNILNNGYNEIKKNICITSLKALLYTQGSRKRLLRFKKNHIRGFQFCDPNLCTWTRFQIFIDEREFWIQFKGFTQEEINFVIQSIKIENS